MIDVLSTVSGVMAGLGIPYDFEQWHGEVSYPYWIGHYIAIEPTVESGEEELDFILTGTDSGTWRSLIEQAARIKRAFDPIAGHIVRTDAEGIAIWWAGEQPVPTNSQDLKRIEITLTIKKWRAE